MIDLSWRVFGAGKVVGLKFEMQNKVPINQVDIDVIVSAVGVWDVTVLKISIRTKNNVTINVIRPGIISGGMIKLTWKIFLVLRRHLILSVKTESITFPWYNNK